MAIGSSLTKVDRRTGEINKPQFESPSSDSSKTNSTFRKGSNQGGSDSESTSFSSSVYGSTSSADRFSSGSLRSLRISRKKNTSFSESKALNVEDSHLKKATFSSILKDSKFSHEGVKESEKEVLSAARLCPYEHCSLHGRHEPPLKRFSYLKRRSSKDQKGVNPQIRATGKQSVTKTEVKVTKKVSNECGKKSCLVDQQLEGERRSCFDDDDDAENQEKETQKMFATKMVREEFEKIFLPDEGDSSGKNQGDDENKRNEAGKDTFGTKKVKTEGWNRVKKVVLMRRFITELEKTKNKSGPDKRGHVPLVPEPEPEAEIVSLRSPTICEKKNANEWMLDYALQQVVAELAPTQRRKVALLVKSFEMVTPKHHKLGPV